MKNCPVTRVDILATEDIFAPNLGSLKGKTRRIGSAPVPSLVADVPTQIVTEYQNVTLCIDLMFVNKEVFLVTVSRVLRFGTTARLKHRGEEEVTKGVLAVLEFYMTRRFRVRQCFADGEFEVLRPALANRAVGKPHELTTKKMHPTWMTTTTATSRQQEWSNLAASVVEDIISKLNDKYGKVTPVTVSRGLVHEYVGRTLDYSKPGRVSIRMDECVANLYTEAPDDMDGTVGTPAGDHLFTVDDDAVKLPNEKEELFHKMTAQLLFLCKRARPDIQTAVAFLTTRVQKPDEDDYKKLARTIKYLRGTPKLCLNLEADSLTTVKWWVDASFAVHRDLRSHTGGVMSLGRGAVYSTSNRQKLNTTSSTTAELVVDDVIPMILWTRQFLMAQGYDVEENVLFQDNQSAILLERTVRGRVLGARGI